MPPCISTYGMSAGGLEGLSGTPKPLREEPPNRQPISRRPPAARTGGLAFRFGVADLPRTDQPEDHTDNTGDAGRQLALSQQRADGVRMYLIQRGVPAAMLVAKGYGDARPIASNDTEEGRFRNHRIEFTAR